MTNFLYSHSSVAPVSLTRGTSSTLRAELDLIAAAFDIVSNSVMGTATEYGSSNNFLLTVSPVNTANPTRGTVYFQATHSNTGASTVQFGALATMPLLGNDGGALTAGAISAGSIVGVCFFGSNAYLLGPTKAYVDGTAFTSALPGQGGNAGKWLQTNGTIASWQAFTFGSGTVAAPALTVGDSGTGYYKAGTNQISLSINGVQLEANASTGKTLYGNLVFGTGVTFPVNMSSAQLLTLTGAAKADGTGASGTWGISISGSAATAASATTAGSATTATSLSGSTQWSVPYQSASATTSYLSPGVAGQLLTSAGGAAPTWDYPLILQNSQSANYTVVASDAGKHIYHPAADTTARTWTIDSNANVPHKIGTAITFDNDFGAGAITIAITSDTLVLVGAAGSTGSRTLASGGQATAVKVAATRWRISGTGLS